MVASQQEAKIGRRGRDAALTWDVPPPLESDKVAAAGRPAFAAVAAKHLQALVRQLLVAEGVQAAATWAPLVCELAQGAAAALSPTAAVAHGKLDPRHYIKVGAAFISAGQLVLLAAHSSTEANKGCLSAWQLCRAAGTSAAVTAARAWLVGAAAAPSPLLQVKRLVAPGATPADSSLALGVACRKSLAHKRMRGCIAQPRIMLLAGGLELQRGGGAGGGGFGSSAGSGAAPTSQLSSFDALLDHEQQYLAAAVERIASLSPDVLLVERSVGRCAAAPAVCACCCDFCGGHDAKWCLLLPWPLMHSAPVDSC